MSELERFKRYLKDTYPHPIDEYREAALWHLWQAALSTRKAYGYGVVDKDGDVITVTPGNDKDSMIALTSRWNAIQEQVPGYPFKTVSLFYEDSES